ncbi:GNAT family N-acetyltransferase [Echinicola vietnamensis]|uniref:Acetyltransferase, ribosomal protein N-acetylase n=1 Tax=Echinicola vietnamensis (strain DSM 17526 / LMG 23754 / KMM 6221) TaxID=926556 RepID=L0FYJ5_ECHVK|nr:GNAT family N-acetyltransferase [Echinicola vietnamensis]AGA77710.1 acetyltransferase, ribosomal protein N-acetylase [Echinicola vietnamensis DSM 17526]
MKIEGENGITLHTWGGQHFHKLYPLANNPAIAKNLKDSFPQPYTLHDARFWIEHNIKFNPPHNFAIEQNGQLVGAIGIHKGENELRTNMELGFWLGEPYWGQGIATEAVRLFVPYLFKNFEVQRVFATVYDFNIPCMRVLQKAGFEEEAILKGGFIKNNKIGDIFQFVVLREQFI